MTRQETEQVTREQLRLAQLVDKDQQLALVAINSFVTAYELLKPTAA